MLLFLLGYMGSGKTTIGKRLAGKLGFAFSDLDNEIENGEGMSVKDIFNNRGEDAFRKLERKYLELYSPDKNIIVATGGGTPCFLNNMEWMMEHGQTIYLKTSPDILFGRLRKEKSTRPLIKDLKDDEMKKYIHDNIKNREAYYLQSTLVVDCDKLSKPEIVNTLSLFVKNSCL